MLSPHTGQLSPHTADATLLVLHTFSIRTTDVTSLILEIFSSNCTPCLPIENVAFWCLSRSPHIAQLYPHTSQPSPRTADATILVLCTFSSCTADVRFLILPTFSSNQTPCPPTAYVAVLTLYILSSYRTKFSSYCRCDPAGTTHFLYSYRRCDISDTVGFLFTPDTICLSTVDVPFLYCTLSPHTAQPPPCTADVTLLALNTF